MSDTAGPQIGGRPAPQRPSAPAASSFATRVLVGPAIGER